MTEQERELAGEASSSGRRGFMVGAGTLAGLAVIGNTVGAQTDGTRGALQATEDLDTASLPYTELDPEAALKLGRENYHDGLHCSQGSLDAIVTLLREEVGGPWHDVPTSASLWAMGGGAGWGSNCGAIVGSNTAISLVYGKERESRLKAVVDELQRWYTQHRFPAYTPTSGKITEELPRSRSGSILCHVSVTEWCKASGYASGSAERSERCSRVTGETAARAIELLNADDAGDFAAEANAVVPESVAAENGCRSCHHKGPDIDQGQSTRGKMGCLQCHTARPHLPDTLDG